MRKLMRVLIPGVGIVAMAAAAPLVSSHAGRTTEQISPYNTNDTYAITNDTYAGASTGRLWTPSRTIVPAGSLDDQVAVEPGHDSDIVKPATAWQTYQASAASQEAAQSAEALTFNLNRIDFTAVNGTNTFSDFFKYGFTTSSVPTMGYDGAPFDVKNPPAAPLGMIAFLIPTPLDANPDNNILQQ